MKKRIAVLSPDSFLEKSYHNLTLPERRVYQISKLLSSFDDFDVTVLVPTKKDKDIESFNFNDPNIYEGTYSFSAAYYSWSEELDRKLLKYDFVIIQTATGVGFQNCSVLPKKINVIVDAWIPMITQYPVDLLNKHRIKRRFSWETFLPQYQKLLQRANCLLCANDKQRSFYEGQFFMIEKLGWDAFKFSPIHKIPYSVVEDTPIREVSSDRKKIIWFGDIHQYEALAELIKAINGTDITLDIIYRTNNVDIQKNRYSLTNIASILNDNVNMINANEEINFNEYYAGVYINNNWLEDNYSNNSDIFELLFRGIPVYTNNYFELHQEYPYLINNGVYYTPDVTTMIKYLNANTASFSKKAIQDIREQHAPDKIAQTLINYIRAF